MQITSFAVVLALFGASEWSQVQQTFVHAVEQYVSIVKRHGRLSGQSGALAVGAARGALDTAAAAAFSPETAGPPLASRIATLLPVVDRLAPEQYAGLYDVLRQRSEQAFAALTPDDATAFEAYAHKLWGAKTKKRAAPTAMQRMIFADHVDVAIQRAVEKRPFIETVRWILERETAWIKATPSKPVSLRRALKLLKNEPESASIYPVLDALDAVYRFGSVADVNAALDPFVSVLIELLGKLEIRVKSSDGTVLDADDERSVAQYTVWFRVSRILRRWTGRDLVWSEDWRNFWSRFSGEANARFDYHAVNAQRVGVSRTKVVRQPSASFFGIEAKTSKVLLLVDLSGSMNAGGNPRGEDRLAALKTEVTKFIKELRPGVHYNILPFSSECDIRTSFTKSHVPFAKRVPRGEMSSEAVDWLNALVADGLTRVDLAFETAFRQGEKNEPNKPVITGRVRPRFSEIYFLTDGSPTDWTGAVLDAEARAALVERITAMNARHRVIIHTIGYSGMNSSFLRAIAAANGGTVRMIAGVVPPPPQPPPQAP